MYSPWGFPSVLLFLIEFGLRKYIIAAISIHPIIIIMKLSEPAEQGQVISIHVTVYINLSSPLTCVALAWAGKAVLEALVVGAGGLGGPQQGQEPPHRHLVVENAFARVKASVCHALTVFFWKY